MKYLASPLPFNGSGQVCLTPLVLPAVLPSFHREFQLLFVTVVNGNQASLMIVLHLEPLSEVGSPPDSPVPEERDPSSLHPPLVVNNDENIFFPGHPFRLRCPLCPHKLEIGEICFHPNCGVNILRRSPEDAQTREEVFHRPFEFLRIIPRQHILHPHYPSALGSPSTSTLVEEAIRTVTILSFPTSFVSCLTSISSHRSPERPPPKHSFLFTCCA